MENNTQNEELEADQKAEKEKAAAYVCRSCGVVAPKKKGLCRPKKIRKSPEDGR